MFQVTCTLDAVRLGTDPSSVALASATERMEAGDMNGAETGVQDALKADPERLEALLCLATLRQLQRRHAAAIPALDSAAALSPDDPWF